MLAVGALDRNMAMVRDLGIFLSNMGVWWEYCLTLGAPGLTTSGIPTTGNKDAMQERVSSELSGPAELSSGPNGNRRRT